MAYSGDDVKTKLLVPVNQSFRWKFRIRFPRTHWLYYGVGKAAASRQITENFNSARGRNVKLIVLIRFNNPPSPTSVPLLLRLPRPRLLH